jgi:hypothetical protein
MQIKETHEKFGGKTTWKIEISLEIYHTEFWG